MDTQDFSGEFSQPAGPSFLVSADDEPLLPSEAESFRFSARKPKTNNLPELPKRDSLGPVGSRYASTLTPGIIGKSVPPVISLGSPSPVVKPSIKSTPLVRQIHQRKDDAITRETPRETPRLERPKRSSVLSPIIDSLAPTPGPAPRRAEVVDSPTNNNMGLKQRERLIDDLKKENMNLKLNIFYLHEQLEKLAPDSFNHLIKDSAEASNKVHQLESDLETYRLRCEKLEAQIKPKDAEIRELREANSQYADAYSTLSNELDQANRNLDSMQLQLKSADDARKSLESAQKNVQSTIQALEKDVTSLTEDKSKLETKVEKLRDALDQSKSSNESLQRKMNDLTAKVESSEKLLEEVEDDRRRAQDRLQDKESQTRKMERDYERLKSEVDRLQKQLSLMESSVESSHKESRRLEELQSRLDSLRKENDRLEMEASQAQDLQRRLESFERRTNSEKDRLEQQLERLKQELSGRDEELSDLRSTIQRLQQNPSKSQALNDALAKERAAQETILALQAEKRALLEELETMQEQSRTGDARVVIGVLKAEKQALTQELESLTEKYEQLESRFKEKNPVNKLKQARRNSVSSVGSNDSGQKILDEDVQQFLEGLEGFDGAALEELKDLVRHSQQELLRLAELVDQATDRDIEWGKKVDQLTTELQLKSDEVVSLREQVVKARSKLDNHDLSLKTKELEIEALKEQIDDLNDLLANAEENRESAHRDLREQLLNQRSRLSELERTNRELSLQNNRLRHDLEVAEQAQLDAERRLQDSLNVDQLEEDRNRWEKERSRWKEEASQAEKRLRNRVRDLEDLLKQREVEDRHVKELLQARTEEVNNLRDHIFRRSRHDESKDLDRFKDETKRVKQDNALLTDRCRQAEATVASLEGKISKMESELQEKDGALRQLESNISLIEKEMTSLRYASQKGKVVKHMESLLQLVVKELDGMISKSHMVLPPIVDPNQDWSGFRESVVSRLRHVGRTVSSAQARIQEVVQAAREQVAAFEERLNARWTTLQRFEVLAQKAAEKQRTLRDALAKSRAETDQVKGELQACLEQNHLLRDQMGRQGNVQLEKRCQQAERKASLMEQKYQQLKEQMTRSNQVLESLKQVENKSSHLHSNYSELSARLMEAQEKLQVERMGAKQRVEELVGQVRHLEQQVDFLADENKNLRDNVTRLKRKAGEWM